MKSINSSLIFACLLAANASVTAGNMVTVSVDTGYHHIGDDESPDFTNPTPEGTKYQKSVKLPPFVDLATSAFVQFKSRNVQYADIIINGKAISIPLTEASTATLENPYRTQLIAVPAGFFKSGNNIIGFESLKGTDGTFDDIEVGEIVIHFQ